MRPSLLVPFGLVAALLAAAAVGCSLNPQPIPPETGDESPKAGGTSAPEDDPAVDNAHCEDAGADADGGDCRGRQDEDAPPVLMLKHSDARGE